MTPEQRAKVIVKNWRARPDGIENWGKALEEEITRGLREALSEQWERAQRDAGLVVELRSKDE